jgi:hypothetical protein
MQTTAQIFVFKSTYLTYKAERVLKQATIPCKLVTKPRHVSSDCGLAIRLDEEDVPKGLSLMAEAGVELLGVW